MTGMIEKAGSRKQHIHAELHAQDGMIAMGRPQFWMVCFTACRTAARGAILCAIETYVWYFTPGRETFMFDVQYVDVKAPQGLELGTEPASCGKPREQVYSCARLYSARACMYYVACATR